MCNAFRCSDYYENSVAMPVMDRFRQSTVRTYNVACIVSDRIFARYRLLRLAGDGYSYRNNTGITVSSTSNVSNTVSLVTWLNLLGLSFRQCSFYPYRYVRLAVQSQTCISSDLRLYRYAIVSDVGFPHR